MSDGLPKDVTSERVRERITLRGGSAWSGRLKRHEVLRLIDVEGRAAVSALFYNAREPLERYNMADTLKAQYTAVLTKGRVLYSDMGRILCSIVDDTAGFHDTITGLCNRAASLGKYGPGGYQELRNDFHRNARDNLLVELGKHGLGKRDLVANVNFFVRTRVDAQGSITWQKAEPQPGAYVDLRAEMDVLVVLSNTPHPMSPEQHYAPPPITLTIWQAAPPGPDDACRRSRPENARGFALTEAYARELERSPSVRSV